jgi:hypothetical protein
MGYVRRFLEGSGARVDVLSHDQAQEFERRWLAVFAANVKRRHKAWVYGGFRWHGFSYGLERCIEGSDAIARYSGQHPAKYVVFDEELEETLSCKSEGYPDLSSLGRDLYVSHANLKWTMVFTHEQPDIGPFFASRDEA